MRPIANRDIYGISGYVLSVSHSPSGIILAIASSSTFSDQRSREKWSGSGTNDSGVRRAFFPSAGRT